MAQTGKTEENSAKRKKLLIIVFIILAIIIVALVAVISYLLGREKSSNVGAQPRNDVAETSQREVVGESRFVLDEGSALTALDEMRKQVEEGMFECSMSTEWTFADGNSESEDAYVANTTNNTHPFYFDVVLNNGSGEVIYASPILPVGTHLTGFKLDKPLAAGTYEAVCKYKLLKDEESQEVISAANFIITISVLK